MIKTTSKQTKSDLEHENGVLFLKLVRARAELDSRDHDHSRAIVGIDSWVRASFANKVANTIVNAIESCNEIGHPLNDLQKAEFITCAVMEGYGLPDELKATVEIEQTIASMAREIKQSGLKE